MNNDYEKLLCSLIHNLREIAERMEKGATEWGKVAKLTTSKTCELLALGKMDAYTLNAMQITNLVDSYEQLMRRIDTE